MRLILAILTVWLALARVTVAETPQIGSIPGRNGNFSGVFNGAFAANDRVWIWVDPTNGSDLYAGTMARPYRTLTNAVAQCAVGGAIFLLPGFYNVDTNSIVLKTNSWLWGSGTNATIVFGFADLQGHVGAQIVPRDNCWINSLQVQCDTNALDAGVLATTHSGSWSGIGFTQDSAVPYKTTSATNWVITHVLVWKAMFDSVHINQNLRWSVYCNDVVCDGVHGFNFLSQNGTHQESFATLQNCKVTIRDNATANVLSAGAYWFPAFLDTDTYIELINCRGEVQTNGNGNIGAAGFAPEMFILDGSNGHGTNTPAVFVDGGVFKNPYYASICEFDTGSNTWGHCNQNGTNVSRLMVGKTQTVTSGNAIEAYGIIKTTVGYQLSIAPSSVILTNVIGPTNVTLDFPATTTLTSSDLQVAFQNVKSNDVITVIAPYLSLTNCGTYTAFFSNTTAYVRFYNYKGTTVDPPSGTFWVKVDQFK